jgi:hypothetical protein
MKHIVTSLRFGIVLLALSAAAVTQTPNVVPFRLISALVQDVRLPELGGVKQQRRYERALVIRIAADRRVYDAQPPDIAAFLYLGSHELRPFAIERPKDSKEVLITFHDPDWLSITKAVPMVLTTRQGDPGRHPARYRNALRFDPGTIR